MRDKRGNKKRKKKEVIMYKQSSKDRSGGWQMESQVVVQSNVK